MIANESINFLQPMKSPQLAIYIQTINLLMLKEA